MFDLARRILDARVAPGSLGIFWIAQAGFVFKTSGEKIVYVDPYLTDCVERLYGFKRIMATPLRAEEVVADLVVSTHSHEDHLDVDAVPVLARNPRIRFAGSPDCVPRYKELGLPEGRFLCIERGRTLVFDGFGITGVYADHGDLAPDAVGVILEAEGIRVWHVGDTAYRPDMMREAFDMKPDVIIPPVNGAFGNLDGVDAARLARDSGARVAIPCHFWMFAEHNGDPAQFLAACREHAPGVRPVLLTQGEMYVCSKA
ncbi:MAG: MBL fold metallo-hydrolase [Firmicutes bacterium]|nr:MBL fold metallo-hydrolase [Bacillota bacterium]